MEVEILKTETLPEAYAKVVTDKAIEELNKQYSGLTIKGIEDVKGYEAVDKARKHVKKIIAGIESTRKDLKSESLEYGRKVDAIAKEITSKVEPLKEKLSNIQDAIDVEKERLLKEEAERLQKEEDARLEGIRKAEEDWQNKIQARQQALNRTGAVIEPLNGYDHYSIGEWHWQVELLMTCSEDDFHRHLRGASVEAEKIKMAKEKEAAELKAKQDEVAETQRKQKEEREALEREKAALADEKRLAAEAKEKEQLAELEATKKKVWAKGKKRTDELSKYGNTPVIDDLNEVYYLHGAMHEDEYSVLLGEVKSNFEAAQKAAAERAEALKPDIQKLREFAAELKKIKIPACTSNEGKKIALDAKDRLSDQSADIISLIKNLR